MKISLICVICACFLLLGSCASKKFTNIAYLEESKVNNQMVVDKPTLNIFQPNGKASETFPVLIFIHGGNWNSGDKKTYNIVGRNFAKKDFVAVIPGYTLSPKANYDEMAQEIAEVVTWTKKNISTYGGDSEQIIVMGHSAGGHLAALVATNPKYLETPEDYILGIVLDDAAGLDMYSYLQNNSPSPGNNYDTTWTLDEDRWKDASPIYFLNENTPPFQIYIGTKTYTSIARYNKVFLKELHTFQPEVQPIYLEKKHVPMVTQLFFPWSKRYDEIVDFSKKINDNPQKNAMQKRVGEK